MGIHEVNERIRVWKIDLEHRLAEHLWKNPELGEKPVEKFRVTISESIGTAGVWSVYVNNTKWNTFYGPNAHQEAVNAMKQLLDRNQ